MKRLLLAAVLAAFAAPSSACEPDSAQASDHFWGQDSSGIVVMWACAGEYYSYRTAKWAPVQAIDPKWPKNLLAAISASPEQRVALWRQYFPVGEPPPEMLPLMKQAWAAVPVPPDPVWTVQASRYATRPAYPVVDGVRAKESDGTRAAVGSACNCLTRSVEGSTTYCAVNNQRTHVAVCTRQQ